MRNQPSIVPFGFLVFGAVLLTLWCGAMVQGAIDGMRAEAAHEDRVKDATPAVYAPWYVCQKEEVERTCRAQRRMEKVRGKQA